MIYFHPFKAILFMLVFSAMMFADVSAQYTDPDNSLKTPLVEKGLPKLVFPVRKYNRNTTYETHLHKNNPPRPLQNSSSIFLTKSKKI